MMNYHIHYGHSLKAQLQMHLLSLYSSAYDSFSMLWVHHRKAKIPGRFISYAFRKYTPVLCSLQFKMVKVGNKSLSDIMYLIIKCLPSYTVYSRLWWMCWECFVLPVTEETIQLFPASASFLTEQTSMLPRTPPALSPSSSFQQRAKDCSSSLFQRHAGLVCTKKFYLI